MRSRAEWRVPLVMAVVGLLAGVVLLAAHRGTAPAIENARRQRLEAAAGRVLPGTARLQPLAGRDGERVFVALTESGASAGRVVRTRGRGYQDWIVVLYGTDRAGKLTGLEILEDRETPGLGDAIREPGFRARFAGRALHDARGRGARFTIRIPGRRTRATSTNAEKPGPIHEIEGISGATISSRVVARILTKSAARLPAVMKAGPFSREAGR